MRLILTHRRALRARREVANDSTETISKQANIEVEQQADLTARETQIRQNLGDVN
jgi:hypothetical protein